MGAVQVPCPNGLPGLVEWDISVAGAQRRIGANPGRSVWVCHSDVRRRWRPISCRNRRIADEGESRTRGSCYNGCMRKTKRSSLAIARLGPRGQLTIPAEYREALALSANAALAVVQVGEALVVAPYDEPLAAVTQRLEAQMQQAGSNVEALIAAAAEARAEIVREEFGTAAEE
jgi:bifunctional DNA-binding transcriptional regulator/antitoxin component of YhaV-PrlF toxin-antitoxin module